MFAKNSKSFAFLQDLVELIRIFKGENAVEWQNVGLITSLK